MKIGIYSYVFYPESFLINELAVALVQRGHEVTVSTSLPNYSTGRLDAKYSFFKGPYSEVLNEIHIKRYPVVPRRKNYLYLTLNYLTNVVSGSFNVLRFPNVDISFVFGVSPIFCVIPSLIQKKRKGTPVVVWLQDLWPESFAAIAKVSPDSIIYRFLQWIVSRIYRNVDVILIQSPAFRENLMKYGFRGRIVDVPNWGPEPKNSASDSPSWLNSIPRDNFVLTFAGNVGKAQGLDLLLNATKGVSSSRKWTVVIVGDGVELKRLKNRVEKEHIENVVFCGRQPLQDMPALFSLSSALYVSLTSEPLFAMTIPSKVQAYMSSGKPLLASLDGQGASVINEANCGLVAPSEDEGALIKTLEQMLGKSEEELAQMGSNGLAYFMAHYQKAHIIGKIEQVLTETRL